MKLIDKKNIKLAESPTFFDNKIFFVDIDSGNICSYELDSKKYDSFHVGVTVGSVNFTSVGDYIVTEETGIRIIDAHSHKVKRDFGIPPGMSPGVHRFNDGKIGPDGKLYTGVMLKDSTQRRSNPGAAKLWCLDSEGEFTEILTDLTTPNGIAWYDVTAENATFFYIDSKRQNILTGVHTFSSKPNFENVDVLMELDPATHETPDGMTILESGELIVAFYRSQKIVIIDPIEKSIVKEFSLAHKYPTSVFAVNNQIYITHAQSDNDEGCLSVIECIEAASVLPYQFS